MDRDEIQDALDAYKRRVASAGGKARAKKLSAQRRKEIAIEGGRQEAAMAAKKRKEEKG